MGNSLLSHSVPISASLYPGDSLWIRQNSVSRVTPMDPGADCRRQIYPKPTDTQHLGDTRGTVTGSWQQRNASFYPSLPDLSGLHPWCFASWGFFSSHTLEPSHSFWHSSDLISSPNSQECDHVTCDKVLLHWPPNKQVKSF